jgi:hypothetical protein
MFFKHRNKNGTEQAGWATRATVLPRLVCSSTATRLETKVINPVPFYFANPTTTAVGVMRRKRLGYIDTPRQGNRRPPHALWCADNGCWSDKFNERQWWAFLKRHASQSNKCWFAVAPDVVGDAKATLARSKPWLGPIRALGYPVAFVAQDGIENTRVPWKDFDVLFIGGTTGFKLGPIAAHYIRQAKRRGKTVHMGRVNSHKRFRYARQMGCDSVDGTYLTYSPTTNLPKLLGWIKAEQAA